ncbi:MAG TPA: M28 family peptidase [Gemmatimonadaceae bacterium]|nr:M28 family peptidase [Gemmatimonadaceae bacterium]
MVQAQLVDRAKALIDDLSRTPRFAGSGEETQARNLCRRELEQAGFTCEEMPFMYSQWLARWGTPLISFALGVLTLAMSRLARVANPIAPAVIIWAMIAVGWASTSSVGKGWILAFPWSREIAVNLEARRGNPQVWLVAHLDSKSQTVPMLLRIVGTVSLYLAAMLVALGGLAFRIWGAIATPALTVAEVLAIIGTFTAGVCFIRNQSPGAVDNASGVAAVLLASQSAAAPKSLGVLITSGEELGLAGALAWSKRAPEQLLVLNCDTVDEAGAYRCMYSDHPHRITMIAENEAKRLGISLKIGRLIPGIMADSMVFSRWHWSAITLSRGTLGTLARIHTRRDNSAMLTGEGAAVASTLLSAIAGELS